FPRGSLGPHSALASRPRTLKQADGLDSRASRHYSSHPSPKVCFRGEAMRYCPALGLALLAASLSTGCVERRYVINSDPPGALVYRDGRPIGTTPVDDAFIYYGKYHFTLVKDGYETLHVEEDFASPWYEYPPLDFFAENVWPWKIRDVRRPNYHLQ